MLGGVAGVGLGAAAILAYALAAGQATVVPLAAVSGESASPCPQAR